MNRQLFVTRLAGLLAGVVALTGCNTLHVTRSAEVAEGATILVTPPRDVVQGGRPHDRGVGSGEQLQESVRRELEGRSIEVVVLGAGSELDHTRPVTEEQALAAARAAEADYGLVLALGEFRDAAPMTFRADFVTLEYGALLDAATGEVVWRLDRPYVLQNTNLGVYTVLVSRIGREVAASIAASG